MENSTPLIQVEQCIHRVGQKFQENGIMPAPMDPLKLAGKRFPASGTTLIHQLALWQPAGSR